MLLLAVGDSSLLGFLNGPGDVGLGAQVELQDRGGVGAREACANDVPILPLKGYDDLPPEQACGASDQSCLGHGDVYGKIALGVVLLRASRWRGAGGGVVLVPGWL